MRIEECEKEYIDSLIRSVGIGNYRGELHIIAFENKFYWAVECDMDSSPTWDWEEINEQLYNQLKLVSDEYHQNKSSGATR